jgi:16S rRNA U516 pseudouridylate synthase RsuA-like enzyme
MNDTKNFSSNASISRKRRATTSTSTSTSTKKGKRVKLLYYLQNNGFASSNKKAKKLIRDNRVVVNGSHASSCSMMVSSTIDGQVVVLSDDNIDNDDSNANVDVDNGNSSTGNSSNDSESTILNSQKHPIELTSSTADTATTVANNIPNANKDITPFCIAYHKPCGMICTTANDSSKEQHYLQEGQFQTLADITHLLPDGYHPIGRLDRHSHGLLLFSTDGRLTSALLSPRTCIPRVYEIIVRGDVGIEKDDHYEDIKRKVQNGVQTDYGFFDGTVLEMKRDVGRDGYAHQRCKDDSGAKRNDKYGLTPEEFAKLNKESSECGSSNVHAVEGDDTCKNDDVKRNNSEILSLIRVTVKEGKKRMVRRLFAALDLFVLGEFKKDM